MEFGKQKIGLFRDGRFSCFEKIAGPDSEKNTEKII